MKPGFFQKISYFLIEHVWAIQRQKMSFWLFHKMCSRILWVQIYSICPFGYLHRFHVQASGSIEPVSVVAIAVTLRMNLDIKVTLVVSRRLTGKKHRLMECYFHVERCLLVWSVLSPGCSESNTGIYIMKYIIIFFASVFSFCKWRLAMTND